MLDAPLCPIERGNILYLDYTCVKELENQGVTEKGTYFTIKEIPNFTVSRRAITTIYNENNLEWHDLHWYVLHDVPTTDVIFEKMPGAPGWFKVYAS